MSARPSLAAATAAVVALVVGVAAFSTAANATTPATLGANTTTARSCATPTDPRAMRCMTQRRTVVAVRKANALSLDAAVPQGLTPTDLASAYKLNTAGGAGAVVAVVVPYHSPNAAGDLAVYRANFNLPACTVASGCLRQLNQNGAAGPLPATDSVWAGEAVMDIEMVSAICPLCRIVMVEANSAGATDLYAAEEMATHFADFVANSWGGPEDYTDLTYDQRFNKPGKVITFPAEESPNAISYPASSPFVIAVGGTHLVAASNARGWTETAWTQTGSGCSTIEPKPSWQTVNTGCKGRAVSDVSAVADPATGVASYDSTNGWAVVGGTGVASSLVAAMYALAGTPRPGTHPAAYPYAHQANMFDVVTGSTASCPVAVLCRAGAGWDGPTGLGSPNGTAAFTAPIAFGSGFEASGPALSWTNTVDGTTIANVGGICCGATGPEAGIRIGERSHTGSGAVMYSGLAKGGTTVYAYMKIYDLSAKPAPVTPETTLSYWIFPQSSATNGHVPVNSTMSECVAIDLIFTDGSTLRDSGAVDQYGNRAHPAYQCNQLVLDTWNFVTVNLGRNNNTKQITRVLLAFDHPGATGGYRGYVDDLAIG